MSSESLYLRRHTGHRDRHTPHLCPDCAGPLAADGRCSRCEHGPSERPDERFPDPRFRLERMERAARS
jgi:hypothetical protein